MQFQWEQSVPVTGYGVGWFLGCPLDGASAPEAQGVVFGKVEAGPKLLFNVPIVNHKPPQTLRMSSEVGLADQRYEENTARAVKSVVLWRTFTHPGGEFI